MKKGREVMCNEVQYHVGCLKHQFELVSRVRQKEKLENLLSFVSFSQIYIILQRNIGHSENDHAIISQSF